jgi:hypothetical protein
MFLPYRSLMDWKKGAYIQDAFPALNDAEREILKTGFHPHCWKEAFGTEEQ